MHTLLSGHFLSVLATCQLSLRLLASSCLCGSQILEQDSKPILISFFGLLHKQPATNYQHVQSLLWMDKYQSAPLQGITMHRLGSIAFGFQHVSGTCLFQVCLFGCPRSKSNPHTPTYGWYTYSRVHCLSHLPHSQSALYEIQCD
jgi:hypothetical protein